MKTKRNELDILQDCVSDILTADEENIGSKDRIILALWFFIKKKMKYKDWNRQKWLLVEDNYLILLVKDGISVDNICSLFCHRTKKAILKRIQRLGLKVKGKNYA